MCEIKRKAKVLSTELQGLRECTGENSIAMFQLLNEVLKDADSLIQSIETVPNVTLTLDEMTLDERSNAVRERSKVIMAKAREISERSTRARQRSMDIINRWNKKDKVIYG